MNIIKKNIKNIDWLELGKKGTHLLWFGKYKLEWGAMESSLTVPLNLQIEHHMIWHSHSWACSHRETIIWKDSCTPRFSATLQNNQDVEETKMFVVIRMGKDLLYIYIYTYVYMCIYIYICIYIKTIYISIYIKTINRYIYREKVGVQEYFHIMLSLCEQAQESDCWMVWYLYLKV